MNVDDHIELWNQAVIHLIDVRHIMMELNDDLTDYRLPSSAFICTIRGEAQVWLEGQVHLVHHFHVLHAGKGIFLNIVAGDLFEGYLILYKAALPHPHRLEQQLLLTKNNPFQQCYVCKAPYPGNLLEKVRRMYENWQQPESLGKLHAKSLFYQFIYDWLWQIKYQSADTHTPDLSEQVIRYMMEHYQDTMTVENIADLLNYSPQYLSRKFKDQMGKSPIQFLIQIRMEKAQELLLTTDASLQEVALSVGYTDFFYFNRMFKKYTGVAPGKYKDRNRIPENVQLRAKKTLQIPIVKYGVRRYIANDDNRYQYKTEGDLTMYINRRSRASMAVTFLLCLTLLLSACGTSGNMTNGGSSAEAGNPTQTEVHPAGAGNKSLTSSGHQGSVGDGTTKTVSSLFGDVVVPVKPQRIVAVDYLGSLVALGVTPVGSSEWIMQNPYIKDKLVGVENVGDPPSIEKIMELEPDLIITLSTKEEQVEKYSKVAPTVSVPFGQLHSIYEEVTYFGELLGLQDKASAWLADYDARVAAAKAKVDKAVPQEATFTILEDQGKEVYIFGGDAGRGSRAIYQSFGRKPPTGVSSKIMKSNYTLLSKELLAESAGDYIVLTSSKTLEQYKADPIWGKLEAFQKGHVYIWNEERSWFKDPIALLSQMEELADWLTTQTKL
ncbi:AraC family transcriptional regulator [Paenibacillus sp. UMB4589-SE434]|uniref:AraC family transcriptional regulator n=1 Tax=Paenibacillus sp. UMB4589-SE434 TaxID=3046314 RepID=UPI002550A60D|nr:AraC family transcriptional regulator [Paenibacillus sp. UMB4589-SE434]MDK8184039.1 AraC family transcriptional regulator [Paenibacillus sp. UMB4589-SE434]